VAAAADFLLIYYFRDNHVLRAIGMVLVVAGAISVFAGILLRLTGEVSDDVSPWIKKIMRSKK
jgi:hypothetical protein